MSNHPTNPPAPKQPPWNCSICSSRPGALTNPRLCDGCTTWNDFSHAVFCVQTAGPALDTTAFDPGFDPATSPASHGLDNFDYRPVSSLTNKDSCMVCSLIHQELTTLVPGSETPGAELAACGLFPTQRTDPSRVAATDPDGRFVERCALAVSLSLPSQIPGQGRTYQPLVLEVELEYDTPDGTHLTSIKRWDRRYSNVGLLRRRLDDCRRHHGRGCDGPPRGARLPPGFRVVDTKLRRVLQPDAEVSFAALGFARGTPARLEDRDDVLRLEGANVEDLGVPGALAPERLPEVVADAVHLCRNLAQRCLWVDQLCVLQEEAAQAEGLDVLYQLAEFVIVPAAGSVGAGLPGVTTRPRPVSARNECWELVRRLPQLEPAPTGGSASAAAVPLPVVRVGPLSESRVADACEWNKRAWTSKARLLARRYVFWSSGHVYFGCFCEGGELNGYPGMAKYRQRSEGEAGQLETAS